MRARRTDSGVIPVGRRSDRTRSQSPGRQRNQRRLRPRSCVPHATGRPRPERRAKPRKLLRLPRVVPRLSHPDVRNHREYERETEGHGDGSNVAAHQSFPVATSAITAKTKSTISAGVRKLLRLIALPFLQASAGRRPGASRSAPCAPGTFLPRVERSRRDSVFAPGLKTARLQVSYHDQDTYVIFARGRMVRDVVPRDFVAVSGCPTL